jgi:TonB family protein
MIHASVLARSVPLLLGLAASCGGRSSPPATDPTSPAGPTAESNTPLGGESSDPQPAPADGSGESKPASADSEGQWEGEAEAVSKPGAAKQEETRTTPVIQKIVLENRKPVRDCYEKAKKELPDLKGTMTIKFTLDPDGNVKKAELNIERSDVKAPTVVDCAIAVIKKIKFPPSSRGMDTTVNYPFDFKPGT